MSALGSLRAEAVRRLATYRPWLASMRRWGFRWIGRTIFADRSVLFRDCRRMSFVVVMRLVRG